MVHFYPHGFWLTVNKPIVRLLLHAVLWQARFKNDTTSSPSKQSNDHHITCRSLYQHSLETLACLTVRQRGALSVFIFVRKMVTMNGPKYLDEMVKYSKINKRGYGTRNNETNLVVDRKYKTCTKNHLLYWTPILQ